MSPTPVPCRVCNGTSGEIYHVREMMFGTKEPFTYFQCDTCGCLQIAEIPDDLSPYYPDTYYSFAGSGKRRKGLSRWRSILRRRYAIERRGLIGKFLYSTKKPNYILRLYGDLGLHRGVSVLDVGCGTGKQVGSVADLREIGFARVLGADPFVDEDVMLDGELLVKKGEVHEVDGTFDFIAFHHSFEHLTDPGKTLRACQDKLAPEGRILIRIPTVTSDAWETYRENWVQLDPPRHLFLFSRESMARLAADCGFVVERVWCDSDTFQFWASEHYIQDISLSGEDSVAPGSEASPVTPDDMKRFEAQAEELNKAGRGDQICVILTRADEALQETAS